MNIGINLLPFREELGGAGKYAKNIVLELSLLDNENHYFLFVTKKNFRHFITANSNFIQIVNPFNSDFFLLRIFWEQFILPFQLKKKKIKTLFTPSVAVPVFFRGRMFTTVHDIAYKKVKIKYPLLRRIYLAFITKVALVKSKVIFTVSNFSKEEIINEYGISPEKIYVIHNGIGSDFFLPVDNETRDAIRAKYNLPEKYILYVGAIEPGKNLDRLIKVFSRLIKESLQNDLHLIMTGGIGWKKESVLSLIHEESLKKKIVILPFIPDNELPVIYQLARILVYISYYEGFGLPVLEGMASGIPVLTSNSPAIKEFAGDAVITTDPFDELSIKKELSNLLTDKEKSERLIRKGFEVSQQFKWTNSAKNIHSILTQESVG